MPSARRGGAAAAPSSAPANPSSAPEHRHHQHIVLDPASSSSGMIALHRARFVDWSPSPVVAAAASSDGTALAAAREDGAIELWETEGWSCILRIPGAEESCITSLAWVNFSQEDGDNDEEEAEDREQRQRQRDDGDASPASSFDASERWQHRQALVSAGLDGSLTLWDLERRRPGCVLDAGGGAIWDLSVDEGVGGGGTGGRRLAAACDDGAVRIFVAARRGGSSAASSSSAPSLKLSAALPRASGRALSVAWHPGGRALVSGSSEGAMRAWDVAGRRELFRVDAAGGSGRSQRGSEGDDSPSSPIWAVAVAADGAIATGDGAGCVSLWDAEHGTLLSRFPGAHAAEVLALVAAAPSDDAPPGGGSESVALGGCGRKRKGSASGGRGVVGPGGTIFSAGADGRVSSFVHQGGGSGGDEGEGGRRPGQRRGGGGDGGGLGGWAAGPARAPHTHDVRCLALLSSPAAREAVGEGAAARRLPLRRPELLVSGGADAQLIVYARSSFETEHPARACRAPQPPLLSVASVAGGGAASRPSSSPLLLAAQRRALDVWRLGVSSVSEAEKQQQQKQVGSRRGRGASASAPATPPHHRQPPLREGSRVDVVARPSRLARIELAGGNHVLSSAISPPTPSCGRASSELSLFVAASTCSRTVLLEVTVAREGAEGDEADAASASVRRVQLPAGVQPAAAVAFAGPRRLLVAGCDGALSVIDLSREEGTGQGTGGDKDEREKMAASLAATLSPPPQKCSSATAATAASLCCPLVSGIACSDCGRWAATWSSGGSHCHVYDLRGLAHHWSPPPLSSPPPSPPVDPLLLAGAAFTADGDLVLLSTSGDVATYDVSGKFLKPPAWHRGDHRAGAAGRRAGDVASVAGDDGRLPGSPTGISVLPRPGSRAVLICTPSALCAADLAAPRTPPEDGVGGGVGGGGDHGSRGRGRAAARAAGHLRRERLAAMPAPAGDNPRPLPLEHPCLGSFYISAKEALLVEAVWADVAAAALPPPVLRRRFGA